MKKFLSLFIFVSLTTFTAFAQTAGPNDTDIDPCSTSEMYLKFLEDHPELVDNIKESEEAQALFRKEFEKTYVKKDGDTYTIPVVFHVIHNYGDENLEPGQIHDAIRQMNEDFSAQNNGAAFVNPAFAALVANTGIQFALAQRDPDGNCTNGIIRSVSPITSEGGQNLKQLSPAWDRSMYLNIWVCRNIASGAAGYSRYPSSVNSSFGATIDGIVVRSDYVGTIGTSSLGHAHTLTHEVGHYLDLPHVWGSTNDPGLSENCNSDDGVADTPNTVGWSSCPANPESCGSPDNIENYMEYSYCSKMFTLGQSARMIAALNSPIAERSSLWQPENLEATGVNLEAQACVADFSGSARIICAGESVDFSDFSYNGIVQRIWIFEGGQPTTTTLQNPTIEYNTPGIYSVSLAASDGSNTVSTTKAGYIRVLDTAYASLPFTEGFETTATLNSDPDANWYSDNLYGDIDWEITDIASFSGDQSAYVHGYESLPQESEFLYSQTFDLSGMENNATITFKYACAQRSSASDDRLRVYISRDCGVSWNLRNNLSGADLYTVPGSVQEEFVPGSQDEWREATVEGIIPLYFTPHFRVRFEFVSQNGNNIFIDDINIRDITTVSVEEALKTARESIKLYPNPASSAITVEINNLRSATTISLYDMTGRKIRDVYSETSFTSGSVFDMDVSDLPGGMYFLQFASRDGSFSKKFIVEK